jgi:hypothetical protein
MDRLRKALLFLTLASVAIPGLRGFDLAAGGFRLGLLQPFKFFFAAWLAAQLAWMIRGRAFIGAWRGWPRPAWGIVTSAALLDLALAIGLAAEGGGERGRSIFVSLLLGQLALALTALDREFPIRTALRGGLTATILLTAFALVEAVAPNAPWVVQAIRLFREDADSYLRFRHEFGGVGSTLTISALAEFGLRWLPAFLAAAKGQLGAAIGAGLLILDSALTLQRSSALALFTILPLWVYLQGNRRWAIGLMTAAGIAVGATGVALGPSRIYSKYLGTFISDPSDEVARSSRQHVEIRKELLNGGVAILRQAPRTGIGLDGFAKLGDAGAARFGVHRTQPTHVHNFFLEMAVSGGALAGLAAIGLLASTFLLALRRPANPGLIYYAIGQVVVLNTDCRIYVSWLAITFFWWPAIAWKAGRVLPDSHA